MSIQKNRLLMEQQIKRLRGELNEAKKPIPKFETGWDVIEYLDGISTFKKYRNKSAQYDDMYFRIPIDVWNKTLGWSKAEVKKLDGELQAYEGGINHEDDEIWVFGGA